MQALHTHLHAKSLSLNVGLTEIVLDTICLVSVTGPGACTSEYLCRCATACVPSLLALCWISKPALIALHRTAKLCVGVFFIPLHVIIDGIGYTHMDAVHKLFISCRIEVEKDTRVIRVSCVHGFCALTRFTMLQDAALTRACT